MAFTIYDASIPVMIRGLQNLSKIMDKAVAQAKTQDTPLSTLLEARLAPDMHPFTNQIQIASDAAKGAAARLAGICRFRLTGEMQTTTPWRVGHCDFAGFAGDLALPREEAFPRDRLLKALKAYLTSRDMQADWNSGMTAPGEALINALAMMFPFDPAEKQALLEADGVRERASTLIALLEIGGESGPTTLN
jgi:hypothetical protein